MSGIFTCIYHKHQPSVGKCTIEGSFGGVLKSFYMGGIFNLKVSSICWSVLIVMSIQEQWMTSY